MWQTSASTTQSFGLDRVSAILDSQSPTSGRTNDGHTTTSKGRLRPTSSRRSLYIHTTTTTCAVILLFRRPWRHCVALHRRVLAALQLEVLVWFAQPGDCGEPSEGSEKYATSACISKLVADAVVGAALLRTTATHLTNYMFDGARAELTKGLSVDPAFQVAHSFALGSQTSLPSYNFTSVFANQSVSPLSRHRRDHQLNTS